MIASWKAGSVSIEAVEAIIGKILLDAHFREALFARPDQTLAGFDLTAAEIAGLKSLDAETADALAQTLQERAKKWREPGGILNHPGS